MSTFHSCQDTYGPENKFPQEEINTGITGAVKHTNYAFTTMNNNHLPTVNVVYIVHYTLYTVKSRSGRRGTVLSGYAHDMTRLMLRAPHSWFSPGPNFNDH